jgi:2-C-methyl-D-erythritol 4-phosphate cytidylyltransferase/2-C-methyl-D-erythritol 2,4-cyclodiphosphate synthase
MTRSSYTACIVAAGRGLRAGGGLPKQFRSLAGRPVLAWSVERFAADPQCRQIVIAVPPDGEAEARHYLAALADRCEFVSGGATRTASVANAVAAARQALVLVHDAARPLLSQSQIDALLEALKTHDGAAPALPVADALVREDEAGVTAIDRTPLRRVQTPQAFRTEKLKRCFADRAGEDFPDEVSLARACGLTLTLTHGDELNFKLTWPEDFNRAEQILAPSSNPPTPFHVTGSGYDVHRLEPGDGVHLCGVFIECPLHLVGHSDADAGLHAITDALLGAAGLGDIGEHFPPTDERWRGADSVMFLEHAVTIAAEAGAVPVHCDVTLICERPKIGPHKPAMKARVAEILSLPVTRVNIKATTTEKLGFTGRGEGLAAEAVVTCAIKEPRA